LRKKKKNIGKRRWRVICSFLAGESAAYTASAEPNTISRRFLAKGTTSSSCSAAGAQDSRLVAGASLSLLPADGWSSRQLKMMHLLWERKSGRQKPLFSGRKLAVLSALAELIYGLCAWM